jgi:hypothetical protein
MAPLTGYNSNVRHRGRMFHIQTEDTGEASRRVVTQLFADGGRIVKSLRADYSEHLGEDNWPAMVRELMKDQHKTIFVSLRSGELDLAIGFDDDAPPPTPGRPLLRSLGVPDTGALNSTASSPSLNSTASSPKVSRRAAPPPEAPAVSRSSAEPPSSGARSYGSPRPCTIFARDTKTAGSLFGGDDNDDKSLDSAILDYLAEATGK